MWTPPSVGAGRGFDPYPASSIRISDGIDGFFAIQVSGYTTSRARITRSLARSARFRRVPQAHPEHLLGVAVLLMRSVDSAVDGMRYAREERDPGRISQRHRRTDTSHLEAGGVGSHPGCTAWTVISTIKVSVLPASKGRRSKLFGSNCGIWFEPSLLVLADFIRSAPRDSCDRPIIRDRFFPSTPRR